MKPSRPVFIVIILIGLACASGRSGPPRKSDARDAGSPALSTSERGHTAAKPTDYLVYTLTISEHRQEQKQAALFDESSNLTFESDVKLFGRIGTRPPAGRHVVVYADSIAFDLRSPYALRTFMSADTMYYDARGGRSVVNRKHIDKYDDMLACVFSGPSLRAVYRQTGALDSISHLKDHCESGLYSRINVPVTMGLFLPDSAALQAGENSCWVEHRDLPSFSGVGFHPRIEFSYRIVKIEDQTRTIVVSADSTVREHRTRMKNGEEVVIISDQLHVGGTLVTNAALGISQSGEIRIRETMELLRPNAGNVVINKSCEYTIRFQTR